jgi:hypothetical protein
VWRGACVCCVRSSVSSCTVRGCVHRVLRRAVQRAAVRGPRTVRRLLDVCSLVPCHLPLSACGVVRVPTLKNIWASQLSSKQAS